MALAAHTALASKACATRGFLGRRVSTSTNGCRVVMKAGNWLPGTDAPSWLDDSIPGNYGFDPLSLGKDPDSLKRFRESEVYHCRWAMLGVAGALGVEALGYGDWYSAPLWAVNGGTPTWFGINIPVDLNTLILVEFAGMAVAEAKRGEEPDFEKKTYPGGAFNPMGLGAKGGSELESYKLKEIKNGRLAMLSFIGFVAQHAATGKTPLAALSDHISNPWGANFATNGVSVPFL